MASMTKIVCKDYAVQVSFLQECKDLLFDNLKYVDIYLFMPKFISLEQYTFAAELCLKLSGVNNIWALTGIGYGNEYHMLFFSLLDEIFHQYLVNIKVKHEYKNNCIFNGQFKDKTAEELVQIGDCIIKRVTDKTNDLVLHEQIFQWLAERNLSEQLIKLHSPHLDNYMATKFEIFGSSSDMTLYKYLTNRKEYKEAAQLLYEAATKNNFIDGLSL